MLLYLEMLEFGYQRPLETTIELEFTDSGVVVLNLATRNAKSKAQFYLTNDQSFVLCYLINFVAY